MASRRQVQCERPVSTQNQRKAGLADRGSVTRVWPLDQPLVGAQCAQDSHMLQCEWQINARPHVRLGGRNAAERLTWGGEPAHCQLGKPRTRQHCHHELVGGTAQLPIAQLFEVSTPPGRKMRLLRPLLIPSCWGLTFAYADRAPYLHRRRCSLGGNKIDTKGAKALADAVTRLRMLAHLLYGPPFSQVRSVCSA